MTGFCLRSFRFNCDPESSLLSSLAEFTVLSYSEQSSTLVIFQFLPLSCSIFYFHTILHLYIAADYLLFIIYFGKYFRQISTPLNALIVRSWKTTLSATLFIRVLVRFLNLSIQPVSASYSGPSTFAYGLHQGSSTKWRESISSLGIGVHSAYNAFLSIAIIHIEKNARSSNSYKFAKSFIRFQHQERIVSQIQKAWQSNGRESDRLPIRSLRNIAF
ncbi:hypothetical protein Tsp_09699 [Trichinella spiralis]|uniref:hypothetical protein n=1 Tax=Trichinella spiralis TaxID=6334 RepID=UPI0001EFD503|nr:hypothetical protein Tsp_09699 [Trichinella spiralis]